MGNSIIINTTTIKDNVNELDNDRKYYSNKKAAFSKII